MWHMNGIGWAWWFAMSIGMVAFWALVIYAVVWLVRGTRPEAQEPEAPLDLLKRRLAAGEITLDEYERTREALTKSPPAQAA